jgi:ketosteroid isomerase-like protein
VTTTTRTVDALGRALESSDAAALTGLYADDAEVRVVDRRNTPKNPLVLKGKEAIEAHWTDVCGRDMTHAVSDQIEADGRLALTETCRYSDGTQVICATLADVADGRITRQVVVQAWDED